MSRPPLFAEQTASGIAINPRTLERVIPESRRPDGSIRKEIRIRPGFTPQEDISRFRGTRQQAMDTAALPKGHILGWVAPSSESQQKSKGAGVPPPNKNARRRANQKARKGAERAEAVKDSWEDDEDVAAPTAAQTAASKAQAAEEDTPSADKASASESTQGEAELTDKLSKLEVE